MKASFQHILFSLIAFSFTYGISYLTKIELVNYAVVLSFLFQWTLFIPAYLLQTEKFLDDLNYIYVGLQIIKPEVFSGLDLGVFSINKIWDQLIQNNDLFAKISNIDFLHVSNLNVYKSLLEKYFKH